MYNNCCNDLINYDLDNNLLFTSFMSSRLRILVMNTNMLNYTVIFKSAVRYKLINVKNQLAKKFIITLCVSN